MSDKTVPLKEATAEQMRTFAKNSLGMAFPANTKEETMRAKIASAWAKPEIPVASADADDADALPPSPPRPVTAEQQKPGKKMVRIIIAQTEEPGGADPVPVGVNGSVMIIPRGKEVDIPLAYFEVLKNAVQDRYVTDEEGNILAEPRKVPAYPWQRVA